MAKRIKSACLYETILFELPSELAAYRAGLNRKKVKHTIDAEERREDGTILVRIRRQYNSYAAGEYMN